MNWTACLLIWLPPAIKLGMAKDVMAAKPMVLYESDEFRRP